MACSDEHGQLTGKWQKSNDSGVTIEFTESGQYYLAIKGEKIPPQRYDYRPDSRQNNLQIGEDTAAVIANVEFLEEHKIRIRSTKPIKMTLEYYREGHAPATIPHSEKSSKTEEDSIFIGTSTTK